MRPNRKSGLLETIALGLFGTLKLVSSAPAQETKPIENPLKGPAPYTFVTSEKTADIPKSAEDKKWALYFENTFASDYVFSNGMVIGRDPRLHGGVHQALLSATRGNFNVFAWTDTDFQDREFHEIDIGADYTFKVDNDLSATAGFYSWHYPSGLEGAHSDWVVRGAAAYTRLPIKLEACVLGLLPHDEINAGACLTVKASKEFKLGNLGGFDVSIVPLIEAGLTYHFYNDNRKGLDATTAGVELNLVKGPWSFKGFYKRLDGKRGVEDINFGGVSIGYSFP